MARKYVLAADVGGTKTEIVLAAAADEWPGIVARERYPSQEFESLEAVIARFLESPETRKHRHALAAACVCLAGPVEADRAATTNLPWTISAARLSKRFRVPAVRLVNDFAAAAVGIARLEGDDLVTLQAGEPVPQGPRAVLGAGTGLGVALMTYAEAGCSVHASEAGHVDFAPVDDVQAGLLACLRAEYGRVSYERVLSGSGLEKIFHYLATRGGLTPTSEIQSALAGAPDAAAIVSAFGLERRDPVAARALDVFAAVYGAFAGNIALTVLARGGVYIAGGIAPKIAAKLKDGTLVRAFTDKGRFSDLLAAVPLYLVMNARVGLYGALELARGMARSRKPRRRTQEDRP